MWILIGALLGLIGGLFLPISLPKGAEGFWLMGILWLGGLLLDALSRKEEERGAALLLRASFEGALLFLILWLGRRTGLAMEQAALAVLLWRLLQGGGRLFQHPAGFKFRPPFRRPRV
ncbi:MAG: hypothetical protein LBU47_02000 [Christensenellaceae bacterium]|jgi:uncharacterized membrane protein YeaQ/YmgE (transglycosylase-associated protein family)|nr:hypothetical protein [Christensenellaceae bacterium]